jgi:hypothetical protein
MSRGRSLRSGIRTATSVERPWLWSHAASAKGRAWRVDRAPICSASAQVPRQLSHLPNGQCWGVRRRRPELRHRRRRLRGALRATAVPLTRDFVTLTAENWTSIGDVPRATWNLTFSWTPYRRSDAIIILGNRLPIS